MGVRPETVLKGGWGCGGRRGDAGGTQGEGQTQLSASLCHVRPASATGVTRAASTGTNTARNAERRRDLGL